MGGSMCVRKRESVCVCECMRGRNCVYEQERGSVCERECVHVRVCERGRGSVCESVCDGRRGRARVRGRLRVWSEAAPPFMKSMLHSWLGSDLRVPE